MDDEGQHGTAGSERQPRKRNRLKGFRGRDGEVINRVPLGRPVEGHGVDDIAPSFGKLRLRGPKAEPKIRCFELSLRLNARAVCAYGEAATDLPLPPETLAALERVPDPSKKEYREAVVRLTGMPSVETHASLLRDEIGRAAAAGRTVQELERRLRIRKVLRTGLYDARLLAERLQDLKRENIARNRHPTDAVVVRTFVPFLLPDPELFYVEQIEEFVEDPSQFRPSSDVEPNELRIMAFDGLVNAGFIYLDFHFMRDLLDLTIYAGAFALGARRPMGASDVATYRKMLCDGGEDVSPVAARPRRANYARALRERWREVPGLAAATEHLGHLTRDI